MSQEWCYAVEAPSALFVKWYFNVLQAKLAEQIKHVHSEQLKKLQVKHQQDADLLEDTRSVTNNEQLNKRSCVKVKRHYASSSMVFDITHVRLEGLDDKVLKELDTSSYCFSMHVSRH